LNQLFSAEKYLPKIAELPLILAGPILRRTEANRVTVWLAIKEAQSLNLEIYETEYGKTVGKLLFKGQRDTIALGKHIHLVAITARPCADVLLQPGGIYAYNIYANSDRSSLLNDYNLSYYAHQLPTFVLPPQDLNQLNIVHGSCRKPHGGGRDTLFCLDNLIENALDAPENRPHQLFLTGDQIYGDDVANPMLWLAQGVNKLLFGWSEELPLQQGTILADYLPPGQRSEIARIEGGFTAMLHGKSDKAKSHLFSFGEYAAAYIIAWSPILLSERLPDGKTLFRERKAAKQWEKETYDINSFLNNLGRVRRALANIAVYTMCDDHDISDDWYLNRQWCESVLSKPLGKRVVQNGLLAYALFQAWGNTPEQFETGTSGAKLLESASRWLLSKGRDKAAKLECDRFLGIPQNDELTGLPKLQLDEDVLILSRDTQAITWNYTVNCDRHEVIVLDTRTWRGYPPEKNQDIEPPMLLCHTAFQQQLQIPLSQSKASVEATIIVLPTNLVALKIIDRIQQFELSQDRVFSSDVGDSWNFHQEAFVQLLLILCRQRQRVIILSGDIHYSCAVRLTHWFHDPLKTTVLVQLTSSAIKNSELSTRLVHTKLKSLFPEKTERWLGWEQPFKLEQIKRPQWWRNQNNLKLKEPLPDWQYCIQWCKRKPTESLPWQPYRQKSPSRTNLWQKFLSFLLAWVWRNPWFQEGSEVIGKNNISLVKFRWSTRKTVIQETYWHPPWDVTTTVKSRYEVSLESDPLPPLFEKNERIGNRD
jgi:hypothetical protein